MTTKFLPNQHYMIIHYRELEAVWRMFADPAKIHQVTEAIEAVRRLNGTAGPDKALMTLVAASTWLAESGTANTGDGNGFFED